MFEVTRKQLGKIDRALRRLGKPAPTKEEKEEFVRFFLSEGIDPALTNSAFLAEQMKNGKKPDAPLARHSRIDEVIALHDEGLNYKEIDAIVGIGMRQIRHLVERVRIEREAAAHAIARAIAGAATEFPVEREALPPSAQKKLDLALRQQKAELERQFYTAVHNQAQEYLRSTAVTLQREQDEAKAIMRSREGFMTKEAYRAIRSCLHPDRVTDPQAKARYEEAFRFFSDLEKFLLPEKDSPTPFISIPRTAAEWEENRRKAAAARKAQRRNKEKDLVRS
jgi:transposase